MDVITIKTFSNTIEANLVKARFETENIPCNIINQTMDTAFKFDDITVAPIQLQVRDEDVERAKKLLEEIEAETN